MSRFDALQCLAEESARVAREAFSSIVRNPVEHYLYYKPMGLELAVAPDAPQGFELGHPQRVPPNLTVDQMAQWIEERAGRLPVLSGEVE